MRRLSPGLPNFRAFRHLLVEVCLLKEAQGFAFAPRFSRVAARVFSVAHLAIHSCVGFHQL